VNLAFEKTAKYFLWVAGAVTTLGAFPMMVSPAKGLYYTMGLTYFNQSPQLAPIIGHWGIMVTGIGVLLFYSATHKEIRKAAVIYATLEKLYIVSAILYCFAIHAPYAHYYMLGLVVDGPLALGGLWYLLKSRALNQA
jgi:hypothetical protein